MKVIAAIRRGYGFGGNRVLFRGQDADEFSDEGATVSLSRVAGKCLFTLPGLIEHDGHAPGWTGPSAPPAPAFGGGDDADPEPEPAPEGPNSVTELPSYIQRVLTDVVGVVGKQPKVAEVHVITDDGQMQPEAETFENLAQAIETAMEAGEHRGIVLVW